MAGLSAIVVCLSYSHWRQIQDQELKICTHNLSVLAAQLEVYAGDNGLLYPKRLQSLIPKYISSIPTCPACGRDTYSATYRYNNSSTAWNFTLECEGHRHWAAGAPFGYPMANKRGARDGKTSFPEYF